MRPPNPLLKETAQNKMLWVVLVVSLLAVVLGAQWARSTLSQRSRLAQLTARCADLSTLHVLTESEFGLVQDAVECVSRLMDNSACPTQLAVHILEPVTSVKAQDIFSPELERACKMASNYSTFFRENVFVHKVHRTRNVTGPSAVRHLLDHLSRTLKKSDIVLWMPNVARVVKGWDSHVRADFAEMKKRGGHIVVHPLPAMPAAHRDIERFFFSEQIPTASFFAVRDELSFEVLPMSRPGVTTALGVSLRHPIACTVDVMRELSFADTDADLALSLWAYSKQWGVMHGSSALGFRTPYTSVVNRRANLHELFRVCELVSKEVVEQWTAYMALRFGEEDVEVFGRSLMGMSAESSLAEILVKWGSEAAFETEKEALKFG